MTMRELYGSVAADLGPDVSFNVELSCWRHARQGADGTPSQHHESVEYRVYVAFRDRPAVMASGPTPYAAYTALCAKLDPPSIAEACSTVDAEPIP